MPPILATPLPPKALLQRYAQSGAYTDCYCVQLPLSVSLADYVQAFYTTPLFKLERALLGVLAGKPSTDHDALQLARGTSPSFAVWTVEERAAHQLLLRQNGGPTRSWLMVESPVVGDTKGTCLYFGSAFLPQSNHQTGQVKFSWDFHALSGVHRLYSRALLRAACKKLMVSGR